MATKLPSTAAETNSAFPCQYGCSLSRGLEAMYKLNKLINPAITFTVLSKASVSTATDCVSHQAITFRINRKTATTATSLCTLKFNSAWVGFIDKIQSESRKYLIESGQYSFLLKCISI